MIIEKRRSHARLSEQDLWSIPRLREWKSKETFWSLARAWGSVKGSSTTTGSIVTDSCLQRSSRLRRREELMLFMLSKSGILFITVTACSSEIRGNSSWSKDIRIPFSYFTRLEVGWKTMTFLWVTGWGSIRRCLMMELLTQSMWSWRFGHRLCTTVGQMKCFGMLLQGWMRALPTSLQEGIQLAWLILKRMRIYTITGMDKGSLCHSKIYLMECKLFLSKLLLTMERQKGWSSLAFLLAPKRRTSHSFQEQKWGKWREKVWISQRDSWALQDGRFSASIIKTNHDSLIKYF